MADDPEKNRTGGTPRPFNLFAVNSKFPDARKIFWAGGQDTNNPDGYVEPSKVPDNLSPMQIPRTIRFVVGGREPGDHVVIPSGFMVEVISTGDLDGNPISVGIATVDKNVQLQPASFRLNFGIPLPNTFWRAIEYTTTA